jgi:hypothetical protein
MAAAIATVSQAAATSPITDSSAELAVLDEEIDRPPNGGPALRPRGRWLDE